MPCVPTKFGNSVAIVCFSRATRKPCHCGRRATLVCDWPAADRKTKTCDKPICDLCRRTVGDKDYCPFHRGDPQRTQAELDLAGEEAAAQAAKLLGVDR